MKDKTKKILSTVVNVVIWIFLAFALVMMIFALSATSNSDGMPKLFGKSYISVQSDSMKGAFNKGDLIVCRVPKSDELSKLKVGEVITFHADINNDGQKNEFKSHRIVAIFNYSNSQKISDEDGNIKSEFLDAYQSGSMIVAYQTQGDNKDMCFGPDADLISYGDVLCVWNDGDARLAGVGSFLDFVGSPTGFGVLIVAPLGIFFLYEVGNLIYVIIQMKQQKAATVPVLDEEEIKRKAIEQYLREEALKKQAIEEYKKQHESEASQPSDSQD